MKKFNFIICLAVCLFLILPGCDTQNSAEEIYIINYSTKVNEYTNSNGKHIKETETLKIDTENQRFEWEFWTNDNSKTNYFSFEYDDYANTQNSNVNKSEFKYETAEGEKLSFSYYSEGNPYAYSFYGPITIYISYADANEKIKNSIANMENVLIDVFKTAWRFESQIQS